MVGTVRPDSGGTETGRDREQSDRGSKSHHENTPSAPAQVPNSALPLRREQFPKLSDDQWRERRAALRYNARPRDPGFAVVLGGSVVSFYTVPHRRRRKFFLRRQAEQTK
jgi:hypothetical protein